MWNFNSISFLLIGDFSTIMYVEKYFLPHLPKMLFFHIAIFTSCFLKFSKTPYIHVMIPTRLSDPILEFFSMNFRLLLLTLCINVIAHSGSVLCVYATFHCFASVYCCFVQNRSFEINFLWRKRAKEWRWICLWKVKIHNEFIISPMFLFLHTKSPDVILCF